MIIDGKKIAGEIGEVLRKKAAARPRPLSLAIVYVGRHQVIDRFIAVKEKFGIDIGVGVEIYRFGADVQPDDFCRKVEDIAKRHDGVVIQLPLPTQLDLARSLAIVSPEKDIDMLSERSLLDFSEGRSKMRPPVAGACEEVLKHAGVELLGKKVTVIGRGRLVGRPVAAWLRRRGVEPTVVGRDYKNLAELLKESDIIISGAGAPGLIKPDMLKTGAVILDAGTSEALGKIAGDADPACAARVSVFTPVPGGLGPITVAVLFQNLFVNL